MLQKPTFKAHPQASLPLETRNQQSKPPMASTHHRQQKSKTALLVEAWETRPKQDCDAQYAPLHRGNFQTSVVNLASILTHVYRSLAISYKDQCCASFLVGFFMHPTLSPI